MRIADLARAEQIPPRFLEFILFGLKNNGVLQSRKGMRQPDRLCALRGLP